MDYLEQEFEQRNWTLYNATKNEMTWRRKAMEFFIIKNENNDDISVSYPLKNSIYNYKTNFTNYTEMYDYVLDKLNYI
jgi:hypothetical protein